MNVSETSANAAALPHPVYHGGKVLKNAEFVSIYYGNFWNSPGGRAERTALDKFAKYFVKSRHTKLWEEYGAGKGQFYGSTVLAQRNEKRVIDQIDIQGFIESAISQRMVMAPKKETVYSVFLPPNAVLIGPGGERSTDGMGGYHGSFLGEKGETIYFSAIVFGERGNGIDFTPRSRDNITITTSHEWTEAVTDPDVGEGQLGWYDYRYGEVSDIPIEILPLEQTFGYRNGYAVQKEWSNKAGAVVLP